MTAHDGFTLNDLVSYNEKHNEANGEANRDGHDHNRSFNYGAEGPTDDDGINSVRDRQKRNFLATLLLSHGVPMLLAGDEFGRSQMGNNNGYCQDSDISWLHWQGLPDSAQALRVFTARLIALRQEQPLLRRESWRNDLTISWLNPVGGEQTEDHWDDEGSTTLGLRLTTKHLDGNENVWKEALVLFNPHDGQVSFNLPSLEDGQWILELTTADPDVERVELNDTDHYDLEPRSLVILRRA